MTNHLRRGAGTGERGAGRRIAGHRGLSRVASAADIEHHNPWPIRAAVIGAIATLLASLGGLYFSAQTSRQATEQAQQAQDAQTTERFSRSVEQLGSDSIAVRIGAVYSFARLMRDSQVDQQAIVEILSTFVRIQADGVPVQSNGDKSGTAPVDFLAALKVLDAFWLTGARSGQPSMLLSRVNLSALVLNSVQIRGADLSNADLSRAELSYAELSYADLRGADLTGADLSYADLSGADLRGADLSYADLSYADLSGADLPGADLRGADLTGADLIGADLTRLECSATTKWPEDFISAPQC